MCLGSIVQVKLKLKCTSAHIFDVSVVGGEDNKGTKRNIPKEGYEQNKRYSVIVKNANVYNCSIICTILQC